MKMQEPLPRSSRRRGVAGIALKAAKRAALPDAQGQLASDGGPELRPDAISLEAAIAMTGISKRTLWRRVSDGTIAKHNEDSRGRAMLAFAQIACLIELALSDEDLHTIVKADSGDANAQTDAGAMFFVAGRFDAAVYWLDLAAAQGNADAMQWLGNCHASGLGVPKDESLAIMWIAKAASLGHPVACRQIQGMKAGYCEP
ncbi:MAG TPA: tetratricopeptide repeat protein [Variovorax sp.]